jgi:4-hydroxy-4-methyl-2-oxoglutarate aldolase
MNTSVIYTHIPVCDPKLIAEAARYGIADLYEALGVNVGRALLMDPNMRAVTPGARIAGQAVTAQNYPGDNLFLYGGLDVIKPGQVLVMTNGGGWQGAQMGDVSATYAQQRRIHGMIVDGPVRDVDAIREMNFPVWSTSISVSHPEKRGPGSVNQPIVVAGVRVEPGDVIVADGDGVLAIPPPLLTEAIDGARVRTEREQGYKDRIRRGESIVDVIGARALLTGSGIERRDTTWRDDPERRG